MNTDTHPLKQARSTLLRKAAFGLFLLASCNAIVIVPLGFAQAPSAAPASVSVSNISTDFLGSRFLVQGKVASVIPRQGPGRPRKLWLDDGTGAGAIVIWPHIWDQLTFQEQIKPGVTLQATITVINNHGTAEGILKKPGDLKLVQAPGTVTATRQTKDEPFAAWLRWAAAGIIGTIFLLLFLLWRRTRERNEAKKQFHEVVTQQAHLLTAGSSVIYILKPAAESGSEYRATYYSENLETLLGYTPQFVLGRPEWWADNIHPDDREQVLAQQAELFRHGTLDRTYRFRHRNGNYRWLHDQQRVLRDAVGQPYEIIGSWFDVTATRKADRLTQMLASLGERLGAAESPREVAAIALSTADELLQWDMAYVTLYSPQDQRLHGVLLFDEFEGQRREFEADPAGSQLNSLLQEVITSGAKLILRNQDEPHTDGLEVAGSGRRSSSLLFAPIRRKGEGIGIISIQSYALYAYHKEDTDTLQVIADYCGAALARTFAEQNRKEAEEALRESEERYALALQGANDGLWDWNLKSNRIYFSSRWKSMLGFSEEEISDAQEEWESRIHPDDLKSVHSAISEHLDGNLSQFEVEYRIRHKDGAYRWMLTRGVAVRDQQGTPYRVAGSQTDITARKVAEEQLERGAYYDALTNLPNRLLFTEQLKRAIARYRRHPESYYAVLFLDLDRFKIINDSLGHVAGDHVLVDVAQRLKSCVRPEDMVARLGGDEFTILLEEVEAPSEASVVAERIQEELSRPIMLHDRETYSTASIGIAFGNSAYETAEEVLRDADAAMYRAKANGKARHELFDSAMHENAMEVLGLESDLRKALDHQEFRVHYQPQISLQTGEIQGFEALVRWEHPERGLLSPSAFLIQAEESDLIVRIGRVVLQESARQLHIWKQDFPHASALTLSVNVSGKQFSQPDFVKHLDEVIRTSGLDASSLILEITETSLMQNAEWLISILNEVRRLGVRLHVDDFGTGYSSLRYLQRFPVEKLKIDRSFVGGMAENDRDLQLVKAVIGLAENMRIGVIAEGIETRQQADLLTSIGCLQGQGFLFHKPLNADSITEILKHFPSPSEVDERLTDD